MTKQDYSFVTISELEKFRISTIYTELLAPHVFSCRIEAVKDFASPTQMLSKGSNLQFHLAPF